MNGFEKRKQLKKQAIIDNALMLFKKDGIKKTSIDEIAKQAKVSKVTIFKYFSSKEQLVHQIIYEYSLSIPKVLDKNLKTSLSFTQKLKGIYTDFLIMFSQLSPAFIKELINDFYDHSNPLASEYYNLTYPYLIQLLNEGRNEGFVRDDISNEAILAYTDFSYKAAINLQSESVIEHQIEIKKMFLYSIVKDNKFNEFLNEIKKDSDTIY